MKKITAIIVVIVIIAMLFTIMILGGCITHKPTYLRDYQIDVYQDTLWLYDKRRFVGRAAIKDLDSLINEDNQ